MEQFISSISTWLADEETLRVIALVAGLLVLLTSVTLAVREYVGLVSVRRDPKAALKRDRLPSTVRAGRLPSTVRGWSKRNRRDKELITTRFNGILYGTALLALFGVVVPGVLLFLLSVNYGWLDPGAAALATVHSNEPVYSPTVSETLLFIVDVALRGALLDAIEVFGIQLAALTNVPANLKFSLAVLLYRGLANAFILFIPVFIIEVWLAVGRLRQEHAKQVSAGKAEARSRTAA